MGLVDAGGAARGADEFVALEQLLVCGRPEVVHLLLLLVLLLLGVVVVVARRVLHHLNITATRMAGVVVRGGCFLLHRPGCVGCVEAFFYARAARFFPFLGLRRTRRLQGPNLDQTRTCAEESTPGGRTTM